MQRNPNIVYEYAYLKWGLTPSTVQMNTKKTENCLYQETETSTSPYITAVDASAVKVCNGCGLNTHNQEHHNWGNCQRCTHPEFNSEEHVAYAW